MNFIQLNPLLSSLIFYAAVQGAAFVILRLAGRKKLNFAFFLVGTTFFAPLFLLYTGYSIRKEQAALCGLLMGWSLLKALQSYRGQLNGIPGEKGLVWLGKMIGLHWLIMLPYTLFLVSRPVTTRLSHSIMAAVLVTLSLLLEIGRFKKTARGSWGKVFDIFHTGTLPFVWGLFIQVSPQLMGMEWLTLAGPICYSILVFLPWITLLTGKGEMLTLNRDDENGRDDSGFYPTQSMVESNHSIRKDGMRRSG
ncbi:MAG: hypothetical protein PQJ59_19280 [Spirochaetales bacterium]|nr:hypothetical protein [Spirochaetales bacterium]